MSESVSDEEINSEESYAENESFDMSEAEEEDVAARLVGALNVDPAS